MLITSFVGRDGSARIVIDGHETKFRAPSLGEARARVRDMAVAVAVETGAAQHFIAHDPDDTWQFYVYPDETISLMPTPGAALPATTPEPIFHPIPDASSAAPEEETVIDQTILINRKAARPTLLVHIEGAGAVKAEPPIALGRRPKEIAGYTSMTLSSPGRECSRTHALVDVDDECRLIVTDQDAANGTEADGTPLAPHTPTVVPNGVRLQLGDAAVRIEAYPPNQPLVGNATVLPARSHNDKAS